MRNALYRLVLATLATGCHMLFMIPSVSAVGMIVRGGGVLMCGSAVAVGGGGVRLGRLVLAGFMMMRRLPMMLSRCLMMRRRIVMSLAGRMAILVALLASRDMLLVSTALSTGLCGCFCHDSILLRGLILVRLPCRTQSQNGYDVHVAAYLYSNTRAQRFSSTLGIIAVESSSVKQARVTIDAYSVKFKACQVKILTNELR
jgi:hypothetical protein